MNNINKSIYAIAVMLLTTGSVNAQNNFMKVVATDGSGDFTTIQTAINSCKTDGTRNFIFIKNGKYFLTSSLFCATT